MVVEMAQTAGDRHVVDEKTTAKEGEIYANLPYIHYKKTANSQ